MKYCEKCGIKLEGNEIFCPVCGMKQAGACKADSAQKGNNGVELTEDRAVAAIAYLGPLAFAALFLAKDSKFVRFHANQGIVLILTSVVYGIVSDVLERMILAVFWKAYVIIGFINTAWLVFPVLVCIGIANAVNGREKELPVIGKIILLR